MGCASSKPVDPTISIYRPAPTSFAVFDINSIEEPWLKATTNDNTQLKDNNEKEEEEKHARVPKVILDKLDMVESDTPQSWEELSKALDTLKKPVDVSLPSTSPDAEVISPKPKPRKTASFHTLEELDGKLPSKPTKELRKTESEKQPELNRTDSAVKSESTKPESGSFNCVKNNIFILKDREERQREGKQAAIDKILQSKRDPLSGFPEKCPPRGSDMVVIYTTSLRGVRRTYKDCMRAKSVFETHRVAFDERDVSLHGEFLNELRELMGEEVSVPRVFIKGRYIGGVDELIELNEPGRLGRILDMARVEKGVGRQACDGCGGARFVPCLECGGSCKILNGDEKTRCGKCNENGLVYCPLCV